MSQNGNGQIQGLQLNVLCRLGAVLPDGSQQARIVLIGKHPDGDREIGNIVYSVYEGGMDIMREMTKPVVSGLLMASITRATSGLVVPVK